MPYLPITKDNAAQLIQIGMLGRGTPYSVKYSPNGEILAVSSSCGIWLYSANTLENEPIFLEAATICENLSFSPDGNTLAACGNNGSVLIWNVHTHERIATLQGYPNVLWAIDFSPDGLSLAVGGQGYSIWIYDTNNFKVKHVLDHHSHSVSSLQFSPNGKYLASRGNDAVWLWEVATGHTQIIFPHPIGDVAFSPNGKNLVIGGNRLWIHSLETNDITIFTLDDTKGIAEVCFSPDGKLLALGCSDKTIRLWDTNSQQELKVLNGHTGRVHSVTFSPDGTKLASVGLDGSGSFGYDSSVRIWDVNTGQQHENLEGFTLGIQDITPHPNNTLIASAHGEPFIRLWDISNSTVRPIAVLDAKEPVWSVAFSPDGKTLASGSHEISLWDIPSYHLKKILKTHRTAALEIGFSFDGQFLAAVAHRPFVKIWNLITGELHRIPEKSRQFRDFWSLAFCPSASILALRVSGNWIWVWDLETNTRQTAFQSDTSIVRIAFSPDKKHIVVGSDNTLNLWNITTGQITATFQIEDLNKILNLGAVTFNSDGTLLAFCDLARGIRLLDMETWSELVSIKGHTWVATKLKFSLDNTLLISSSADGTIRLYAIPSEIV